MNYFKFLLEFSALMVAFEIIWFLISLNISTLFLIIFRYSGSFKASYTYLTVTHSLYCLLIISVSAKFINLYHLDNKNFTLYIFTILTSIVYIFFFFNDKLRNFGKESKGFDLVKKFFPNVKPFDDNTDLIISFIDTTSVIAFIVIIIFPSLVNFEPLNVTFKITYYFSSIKVIGILMGIFGLFSLLRYIGYFLLGLMFLIMNFIFTNNDKV